MRPANVLTCLALSVVGGCSTATQPISCVVSASDGSLMVTMAVPHPGGALLYRPSGEAVYLDTEAGFELLGEWRLSAFATGTVYRDGVALREPLFIGTGRYRLYLAENVETEPENTFHRECYFERNAVFPDQGTPWAS